MRACAAISRMRLRLRESLLYLLLRLLKRFDRRDGAAAAFDPAAVRRILLVSTTALGDTVMSTAAICAVRRRYPGARIVGHFHAAYMSLFARMSQLDAAIPYQGGWRRFFATVAALRRERFDLALILHGNEPQATPMAYLAGIPFIFKLPNASRFRFLLANREPVLGWPDLGSGFAQRLRVAEFAGADTRGARMELPVADEDRSAVAALLAGRGVAADTLLIGLQTGASSRGRMWPAPHFVELAQALERRHPGCRFVLTGSAAEAAYCRGIAADMGGAALVLAGEVPLPRLPALVRRLAVLVTGDTGTLHVAVAVGTPIVGLFALSDPRRSGPAYDLERHVTLHRPCDASVRSKSDDQRWIARIGVGEVLEAVERILARNAVAA
jgi:ADP-heptose:LPS heptosyltransferase